MATPTTGVTGLTNLVVTNGTTSAAATVQLQKLQRSIALSNYANYAAQAGTTGCDLLIAYSIDGGTSYSDFVSAGAKTAAAQLISQKTVWLLTPGPEYCTHVQLKVQNTD